MTNVNDLKAKVYDLIVLAEQRRAEIANIQKEINTINEQINQLQHAESNTKK